MNPLSGELKNPLTNGRVVGSGIRYSDYAKQPDGVRRGDPKWEMTRGELMAFLACPHKWLAGVPKKTTAAMEWGSLIDCLMLTPNQADDRLAICPEKYTDDEGKLKPWNFNANVCKEWKKKHPGKQIVKADDHSEAKRAINQITNSKTICELLACSKTQVMATAEYLDKETGIVVPVKVLLDLVPDAINERWGKCLGDAKQTTNASEKAWTFKIRDDDLHVQAALYTDTYRCACPSEERTDWLHLVSEDHPPYESAIWMLSSDFVELGRARYISALEMYCHCLKTGNWHGYNDNPFSRWINPPPNMLL